MKAWCIPPEARGEGVDHMEDVLAVSHRPYDPRSRQVCMDEVLKHLVGETPVPVAAKPGHVQRYDYADERVGTANRFRLVEPVRRWRHVQVTARRTKHDWAHAIRELVDIPYPEAAKIVLVLDNLNTHGLRSVSEAFPAPEANRSANRLELHPTPKHGSWLNMAEIALRVLSRQCLNRRMPAAAEVMRAAAAWETTRNAPGRTINWRCTTADARIKRPRLYPSLSM